jgi:Carboxypeptidase regulatory-like domain
MRRAIALAVFALVLAPAYDAAGAKPRKRAKEAVVQRVTATPATAAERRKKQAGEGPSKENPSKGRKPRIGPPVERKLKKANSKVFDLRTLPHKPPKQRERPERYGPPPNPTLLEGPVPTSMMRLPSQPVTTAVAPAPLITFEGLDRQNWGAGSPPDTTGDVGPAYYIQGVNTSIGIYRKSDGFREAAFTFDTLMSEGDFGNMCDDSNFGDPVVLYDTFEDRWILTDFAFQLDNADNVSPEVAYQCFAVSMTGDPLTGGWNFYSIENLDGLNDYPKLGVWPDGIYMMANMFDFAATGSYQQVRVWALNKAEMYAGSPTVRIVSFDLGDADFTVIPSNARVQTGTPPPGRPNYFVSTGSFLNALSVYKFAVNWDSVTLSTFTGPETPIAGTSWPDAGVPNAPQQGTGQMIDTLSIRAMVQNTYTNIGGVESLWVPHTVRRANTSGFAAPRWYQVTVTGGTINGTIPQAATWDPDAANVMHRFMPSLAVDRAGNLAMGYSTSSSTSFPSIKYAGRLSTDPPGTFGQTEQTMFAGTASQTTAERWGDYSSMMLDPDGCRFWYTNQYANPASQDFDKRWKTKIGAFKYAECTNVGAGGTVSGTVTATAGGAPIGGAAITFGARTATTNGSGVYSFTNIAAGTYASISASAPGFTTSSTANVVVTDGGTTVRNFSLAAAPASGCFTDTTQAHFQTGEPSFVDLTSSPGSVVLAPVAIVDQATTDYTNNGTGFTNASFAAQTFTPNVSGKLNELDVFIFCAACSGGNPNITVEVRTTSGGNIQMTGGALLASSTIAGTSSGSGDFLTFSFPTAPSLSAATQYGFVVRLAAARTGTQAVLYSDFDGLPGGRRQVCSTSSCSNASGGSNDVVFTATMTVAYLTSGNLVSSVKDANPAAGLTASWSTLTWNATTPANTTVRMQVAASNSVHGPFDYVGPNGTGATYFTTSPASLSQFNGFRYLRYKAYLATTNNQVTPVLSDVAACFVNCSGPNPVITPSPAQLCANSTGNTASGTAGMNSYAWSITNGTITGGASSQNVMYTAGTTGNVGLTLDVTDGTGCAKSTSLNVPIVTPPMPAITPGGPTSFCTGGSVLLTSSSATGNQWYLNGSPIGGATNQTYSAAVSGGYTVRVTASGCASTSSTATVVTVNPRPDFVITVGSPMLSGAPATASVNFGCAGATYAWSITGGTIDGGNGSRRITFTAGAAGTLTLNVTVTNAFGCSDSKSANVTVQLAPFAAPPVVRASATTTTTATVQWAQVATAVNYEVHRSTNGTAFTLRGTSGTNTFDDTGLTPSTTYFYRVRAMKSNLTLSAFSAIDLATTFLFSDDPLTSLCAPIIKAAHVTQLRTAVNLVRTAAGLTAFPFAESSLTTIRAVHINELRTALNDALAVIAVTPAYTDPTLTIGATTVKFAHVIELRDLVR